MPTWQKIFTIIINLYVFFLCSTKSNAGYSISLGLLVLCLFIYYGKKKSLPVLGEKSFFISYGIFATGLLAAAFLLGDNRSIKGTEHFIEFTLPLWVLYLSFQECQKKEASVQWGLLAAMLVLCIPAFRTIATTSANKRIQGDFAQPNNFAMILENSLPFLGMLLYNQVNNKNLAGVKKYGLSLLFGCAFLAGIIALGFTRSRGGIVGFLLGALIIGLAYWITRKEGMAHRKKWLISIAILSICSVSTVLLTLNYFHRRYDSERILLLRSSYAMWQDHKAYGVGFNNWPLQYKKHYKLKQAKEPNLPAAHNNIATFFSTTGLLGGLGYLIFTFGSLFWLLKKIKQQPDNMFLYAMLWLFIINSIHGMVDNTLLSKFPTRIYFGMWGMTLGSISKIYK